MSGIYLYFVTFLVGRYWDFIDHRGQVILEHCMQRRKKMVIYAFTKKLLYIPHLHLICLQIPFSLDMFKQYFCDEYWKKSVV